jgi:hypothetical protein
MIRGLELNEVYTAAHAATGFVNSSPPDVVLAHGQPFVHERPYELPSSIVHAYGRLAGGFQSKPHLQHRVGGIREDALQPSPILDLGNLRGVTAATRTDH